MPSIKINDTYNEIDINHSLEDQFSKFKIDNEKDHDDIKYNMNYIHLKINYDMDKMHCYTINRCNEIVDNAFNGYKNYIYALSAAFIGEGLIILYLIYLISKIL